MSGTGRRARERTKRALRDSSESWSKTKARKTLSEEPTLREKLRYRFDATMARGPSALVGWLGLVTGIMVVAVTLALLLSDTNSGHTSLFGQLLGSLEHALVPGTVACDARPWSFLVMLLILVLAGLFIGSPMICVIATGLEEKLVGLGKGRARVL